MSCCVPLAWRDASGVEVIKTFACNGASYDIAVSHKLHNNSNEAWTGSRYVQLQSALPGDDEGGSVSITRSATASMVSVFTTRKKSWKKSTLKTCRKNPTSVTTAEGWLSMIQHYFFSAWIPPAGQVNNYSHPVFTPDGWPRA